MFSTGDTRVFIDAVGDDARVIAHAIAQAMARVRVA
jgi:hypothetical protein